MQNKRVLIAHLAILSACAIWGLMAPIGKDAMLSGVDNLNMVYLRALGGAVFFWITSLFTKHEHVPLKDIFVLCGAGVFGLVCNQCCFTIGLSITTPSNAAIVTTSLPIFAMIFAALILKEPITGRKALGVGVGCSGAVILIASTAVANDSRIGDIRGDLLCVAAQMSFALYLSLYRDILKRYSPITMSKWMFTWATILLTPFLGSHAASTDWQAVSLKTWLRGILRHLHRLPVHADGATHAAPHRGEHLQLYAARGGGIGEHRLRHVPLHVEASRGCSARLQWRMARNQVKIAKGY